MIDDWNRLTAAAKADLYSLLIQLPASAMVLINGQDMLPPSQFSNYELAGLSSPEAAKLFRRTLTACGYFNGRPPRLDTAEAEVVTHICELYEYCWSCWRAW